MPYIELAGAPGSGKTFMTLDIKQRHPNVVAYYDANSRYIRYVKKFRKLGYFVSFVSSFVTDNYNHELKKIFPTISLRQLFNLHLLVQKLIQIHPFPAPLAMVQVV